ncbi:hypothetical protein, variant 2 [Exophiala oligosperma]|nr:hypothetical protein, variant 1 [Exophiala oligosperma]XP_016256793.1 hypothetical protein, variant 2 [Exophiala oligosperma]KAJ9608579.1 hypothetical protein H2204_015673 [Knufia peltigerae]KIW36576.1 hypothetical protein, variant 1 [Exophiala oligosperma]KIW36577.1 hypothetical protein, variant 2 [Exophiala oligosperma]
MASCSCRITFEAAFTGSMDEIGPRMSEGSRLHQPEEVLLRREIIQESSETGGRPAPREDVRMIQGCRASTRVLTPSITRNSGPPDARDGEVPLTTGSCDAAGKAREAHARCHSGGSPILAGPNAEQVCSTGVEQPGRSPRNAACIVPQPEDAEMSLSEEIDDYDGSGSEEEEERGTRYVNGRKRTCANQTIHSPLKTVKVEHTPEALAERFGTNDQGAFISTLRKEWREITSSQLLPEKDTTALIGKLRCQDIPSFVNFVLQHGRQLEKNSLRGEVQSLKNRMDYAHYYKLYAAASNDTRKDADSSFLPWMREWYRQRNRSWALPMGRGKGVATVVMDCLVDLHLSDPRFKGVPPRRMRDRVKQWRALGELWSKLIEGFGPGILLLAPSSEPEYR